MRIPLDQIVKGPNDRTVFDERAIEMLSWSMEKCGLRSPIITRPIFIYANGERNIPWNSLEMILWSHMSGLAIKSTQQRLSIAMDMLDVILRGGKLESILDNQRKTGARSGASGLGIDGSLGPFPHIDESLILASRAECGSGKSSQDEQRCSCLDVVWSIYKSKEYVQKKQLKKQINGRSDGQDIQSKKMISLSNIGEEESCREKKSQGDLEDQLAMSRIERVCSELQVNLEGDGAKAALEIVAGERRFRAAKRLAWREIESNIYWLDDMSAANVMLLENVAREDLNPIDEARAYRVRIDHLGWDEQECAKIVGVSRLTVCNRLKLLNLIPKVQNLVATGDLHLGHAEEMSDLDANRQLLAVRVMISGRGVTLTEFRRYVALLRSEQGQDAMFDLTEFWVQHVQDQGPVLRGHLADVNVPVAEDLPAPEMENNMTAGEIMHAYIGKLKSMGFEREAASIGRLYREMVYFNSVGLPRNNK